MRKFLLSLTAASALVAGAAILPANAMGVGTSESLKAAVVDASLIEDVAYVCRHRYWSSRRVCWWRPGGYRWHRRWRWHRW